MIFLTGFMGSGKTQVGKALAERLKAPFTDLDAEIGSQAGTTIPEIFRCAGEDAFRFLEHKTLLDVASRDDWSVVATGGGLPVMPVNRRIMKACGCIVHLRASFDTIRSRIPEDPSRPLWNSRAQALFQSRIPAYEDADLIVDTDGLTIEQTADEIAGRLGILPQPLGFILPDNPYPVYIGKGIFSRIVPLLRRHCDPEGLFVLADENVATHHEPLIRMALDKIQHSIMTVPSGEDSKSSSFLDKVLSEMFFRRVNRQWACLALGGGVTGDLAGFASSIYMRGIPVIQAPTTLLAQVDSALGGKTAVNNEFGKNLVGTFHQPLLVLSDTDFLATLDEAQSRSAMAEVIKYGVIMDAPLFEYLEAGPPFDNEKIVRMCSRDKAAIVERDEREGGLRRVLNFGHTLGHALEKDSGYTLPHGTAVAAGMLFASWLSREKGLLPGRDYGRIKDLITSRGIIPVGLTLPLPQDVALEIALDKKGQGRGIHFVLTPSIGDVSVQKLTELEVLEGYKGFADEYARGI